MSCLQSVAVILLHLALPWTLQTVHFCHFAQPSNNIQTLNQCLLPHCAQWVTCQSASVLDFHHQVSLHGTHWPFRALTSQTDFCVRCGCYSFMLLITFVEAYLSPFPLHSLCGSLQLLVPLTALLQHTAGLPPPLQAAGLSSFSSFI